MLRLSNRALLRPQAPSIMLLPLPNVRRRIESHGYHLKLAKWLKNGETRLSKAAANSRDRCDSVLRFFTHWSSTHKFSFVHSQYWGASIYWTCSCGDWWAENCSTCKMHRRGARFVHWPRRHNRGTNEQEIMWISSLWYFLSWKRKFCVDWRCLHTRWRSIVAIVASGLSSLQSFTLAWVPHVKSTHFYHPWWRISSKQNNTDQSFWNPCLLREWAKRGRANGANEWL